MVFSSEAYEKAFPRKAPEAPEAPKAHEVPKAAEVVPGDVLEEADKGSDVKIDPEAVEPEKVGDEDGN